MIEVPATIQAVCNILSVLLILTNIGLQIFWRVWIGRAKLQRGELDVTEAKSYKRKEFVYFVVCLVIAALNVPTGDHIFVALWLVFAYLSHRILNEFDAYIRERE